MADRQKKSSVLANLLLSFDDRPLENWELRTLRFLVERSSIEEIEKSIRLYHKSQKNPSLKGQILKDRSFYQVPKNSKVKKPKRKRGYTDQGQMADGNSIIRRKVLNESLIYLPDLEGTYFHQFLRFFYEFSRGNWFSAGDIEEFLINLKREYDLSFDFRELEILYEDLEQAWSDRQEHPFSFYNRYRRRFPEDFED